MVIVTDRRVLEQQLQNTIYQLEHKTGVVEKIDEDIQQLVRALSQGTPIVITTIQKFPFIAQALSTLDSKSSGVEIDTAGKRFAVNEYGPEGLIDIKPPGRPPKLSEKQKEVLKQLVETGPDPAICRK